MKLLKKGLSARIHLSLFITIFSLLPLVASAGENEKKDLPHHSFMGSVCYIDYIAPGLDFVIMTQERPGQNYLIDNIKNQPFEYIWVHREFKNKNSNAQKEIRGYLFKGYESGEIKVIISGQYSTDMELTKGRSDGYLFLTSLQIIVPDGRFHFGKSYYFDGVVGGISGCGGPPKKKKKIF
ncbi:MAG: hypothetical protein MUP98_16810 [Candidatus Aminicenantes bacterium]|nr:hypothetical protein [Candidatus Aminicenantes bacterium]